MTPDQEEFIGVLHRHQVEYAIIGGKAVQSYGSTRKADDLDIWINPKAANANKMVASVKAVSYTHLAVYKRQAHTCTSIKCEEKDKTSTYRRFLLPGDLKPNGASPPPMHNAHLPVTK